MNTCLVYTKPDGGTHLAWAGHGKARVNASSTNSEQVAAERAAVKYFLAQGIKIEEAAITCESGAPVLRGWNTWEAKLHQFEGGVWSPWVPVDEAAAGNGTVITTPCTPTKPKAP